MDFKETALAVLDKIRDVLIVIFLFIKKWAIIIFKKVRKALKKYIRKLIKRTKAGDYSMLIYTGVGVLLFILMICLMVSCSGKKKDKPDDKEDVATVIDASGTDDNNTTENTQSALAQSAKNAYEMDKNFLTLVNINTPMPEGYVFDQHLLNSGKIVDERIYSDLLAMLNDCNAAGFEYTIVAGYISRSSQTNIYNDKVSSLVSQGYSQEEAESNAAALVFAPGHNEHETGLAIDICKLGVSTYSSEITSDTTYQWLAANCHKYGFIVRYPADKSSVTGVNGELWQFRYVGKTAASFMHDNNLCLEEFYSLLSQ